MESVDGKSVGEYILSRELYARNAGKAAYTRQKGFSAIQHEQMILNYIDQHGQITRGEAMELCHLTRGMAYKLLRKLCATQLERKGNQKRLSMCGKNCRSLHPLKLQKVAEGCKRLQKVAETAQRSAKPREKVQ